MIFWPFVIVYFTLVGGWLFALCLTAAKGAIPPPDDHPPSNVTRIKIMNALEVAQRSFDAWNRHDADAILALYAEGGTYSAPRAGGALTGQAIANFAKALFTAYPDVSLEILSIWHTGGGLVASQWILHGTHTGPYFDCSPPTGRALTLPGASFTQVEGDKIRSEQTYTDRQTVTEQLGFKPK